MISRNKIDIIYHQTQAKMQAEGVRSNLGYVWWVLDPLLSLAIYYLLFKVLLNRGGEDYISFLFIGLIAWRWFQMSITKGASSISAKKNLYKRIYLPKYIFPFVEILYQTWKFVIVFTIILIIYQFTGYPLNWNYIFLPLIIILQFIFITSIVLPISAIIPFIPDMNFLISHVVRLLIYPSAVVFSIDMIPEKYHYIINLNPIALIINSYRDIVMYNKTPNFKWLSLVLVFSIIFTLFGLALINRNDKKYAKLI